MAAHIPTKRPLIIGLPGSFDSAEYSSYASWLRYLPELGADVRILDMLQLPGVRRIAQDGTGASYYCDWHPDDYPKLILSTIAELQPTKVVLLGCGSGAYEAVRSARVLSALGRPVAGVIGVAPHGLTYRADKYREFVDLPKKLATEIELQTRHVTPFLNKERLITENLSSCVRYEDLHQPDNGARSTFYVPERVLRRQHVSLAGILARMQIEEQGGIGRMSEVAQTLPYSVPTAFIAPADSWYLPVARVKALAHHHRSAVAACIELPGVCYDFRAYPSQIDRVTEAVLDKVGQMLTTGTGQQPRPSHALLTGYKVRTEEPVGAIVLSSARPRSHYRSAVRLAKESKTDLIVLASHDLNADIVAADMTHAGVKGCVIDVPEDYQLPLAADFATLKHPHTVGRKSNLSAKRNLGLLYGYLTNQNLFFLDDDIRGLSAKRLAQAGAQLDRHTIAGFLANDYPDNSVVCHANRLAGNEQTNFISGSSLGANATTVRSFFLNVYNEDWLFCHDAIQKRSIVLMGDVRQLPYNPFNPERAVSEEFGDVLAEGLNYLFTVGVSLDLATEDFWRYYLRHRLRFITDIAKRLAILPERDNQVAQALAALGASKRTLATFTPRDFVSYIHAWRDDIERWNSLLAALPQGLSAQEALQFGADKLALKTRIVGR